MMKRVTVGAFVLLIFSVVLYFGVGGIATLARSQEWDWTDAESEWLLTIGYSSIWLMAISAVLFVVFIVAQIIWAYLPRSSSHR